MTMLRLQGTNIQHKLRLILTQQTLLYTSHSLANIPLKDFWDNASLTSTMTAIPGHSMHCCEQQSRWPFDGGHCWKMGGRYIPPPAPSLVGLLLSIESSLKSIWGVHSSEHLPGHSWLG
jgi:hypothetical protein